MGLTFKRDDELQKVLDKFAILPDDKSNPKEKPNADLSGAEDVSKVDTATQEKNSK